MVAVGPGCHDGSFFIGRLGGKAFEDKPWAGLLLALGIAIGISALIELARRIRSGRARRRAEISRASAPGRAGAGVKG